MFKELRKATKEKTFDLDLKDKCVFCSTRSGRMTFQAKEQDN